MRKKKIFWGVIVSCFLTAHVYAKAPKITCGNESCSDYAEEVFLTPLIQKEIFHHLLADNDIKVAVFQGFHTMASSITMPKNSYHNVYYYDNKQSVSVSFFDVDSVFDLLHEAKTISMFKKDGITVYFYEAGNSEGHPLEPIYHAIIPTLYGDKERFIKYVTRGFSEEAFKTLLSHVQFNE